MPKYAVDIRGSKFEIDAPDDAHAQAAVEELSKQPQHFELGQAPGDNPANLPAGFDPATGEVHHTGIGDKFGTFTASVLEGVPVAGPALRSGAEMAAAKLVEATGGKPYEQAKRDITSRTNRDIADNPNTALAGNVVGATAGTLPLMAAAPEAFGLGGGGMMAKSLASAASGAGLGGADSAVRSGGDPVETAKGAAMGGGLGLFGPAAGRLLGRGAGAVRDTFRSGGAARAAGMPKATFQRLTRAMNADGLTEAVARQRMGELGPDAMIMDMGPNLQRQAGALAATPGRAQEVVRSAVGARDRGATQRLATALDQNLGPATVPAEVDAGIRANQTALSPQYEAAFANARAVDTTPIANNLESGIVNSRGEAQAQLRNVRNMLNITGTDVLDPHPRTLFSTRQAIDGMLDGATDGNVRRVLTQTRTAIDNELRRVVPGIKEVDAQFAELARQREAVGRGQEVLDSGRNNAIRPQELATEMNAAAQPQGLQVGPSAAPMRLRQGARAEIDRIVGTNSNDVVALNRLIKGEGDWNRQKLATLFGQERADRILRVLDAERQFAGTRDVVTRNSETAARAAATADLGSPAFGAREGYMAGGAMGAMRSAMVRALEGGVNSMRSGANEAANEQLAHHLASPNVDAVARGLARMGGPRSDLAVRRAVQAALLAPAMGGHNR